MENSRTITKTQGRRYLRDPSYTAKNSKWLQQKLVVVDEIVTTTINTIQEEQTSSFAKRAQMRLDLMKKVEELYTAYCELAEKYDNDRNSHDNQDPDLLKPFREPSDQIPSPTSDLSVHDATPTPSGPSPSPWYLLNQHIEKLQTESMTLKDMENDAILHKYEREVERLKNVDNELAQVKEKLKDVESLYEEQRSRLESLEKEVKDNEEEVQQKREEVEEMKGANHAQKLELELLQQKVKLQKEELKQKREELEIIKPRLSELEEINHELENKVRVLNEEKEILDQQLTSANGKISLHLQELSSLKAEKKNLKGKLEEHLSGHDKIQRDLSHQIDEANKEIEMQTEALKKFEIEIKKYEIDMKELSEKKMELEISLFGANKAIETLSKNVVTLQHQAAAHFQNHNEVLKKKSYLERSLSIFGNKLEDSNRKMREEEERKLQTQNLIRKLKEEIKTLKVENERITWNYVVLQELFKRSSPNTIGGALFHLLKLIRSRLGAILRFYVNFFTAPFSFKRDHEIGKVKEEKKSDILEMSEEKLEKEVDILEMHEEKVEKEFDILEMHGEKIEKEQDILETHEEKIEKEQDILEMHEEKIGKKQDILEMHEEKIEKEQDIFEYEEKIEKEQDILEMHDEKKGKELDILEMHKEKAEKKFILEMHKEKVEKNPDTLEMHEENVKKEEYTTHVDSEEFGRNTRTICVAS